MKQKTKALLTIITTGFLFSVTSHAHSPLSYDELTQAERQRMKQNYERSGGTSVTTKQEDDKWLTNTPSTWGYIINTEKLRMKQSQPQASAQPTSQSSQKPNLMPTTLNEGVRSQHQQ